MTDDFSRAVSFANSYFALVDGLAYGLENHLEDDVSLNWFGKIVKGKRNVAAFMRINMTNSRHIFNQITPTWGIEPPRKRTPRKNPKLEGNSLDTENKTDSLIKNELNFTKLCIKDSEMKIKEENFEENMAELELLLPQAIPVNRLDDITIKREKDENEPPLQNMECEPIDVPAINKNDSIKFIQANGVVQIHRSKGPNKIRKWQSCAFVSGRPGYTCGRECRLQLAYSSQSNRVIKYERNPERSKIVCGKTDVATDRSNCEMKNNICDSKTTRGKKRLNSCEEETAETITELEPSFNPFEGFDSFDDKRRFLECFEAEMCGASSKCNFKAPKYVGDRLVFDWTRKHKRTSGNHSGGFNFNFSIHSIVYESNRRCQPSLSQEFEELKSLSDTEKSV